MTDADTYNFTAHSAFLSSALAGGKPWLIHGIAIGADDVTRGQSGKRKYWPAEELEKAASSLEGKDLVVDHGDSAYDKVGVVTRTQYKEGVGILYEAELYDRALAEKVADGLLDVSIYAAHKPVDELQYDEEHDALRVEGIYFKDLSIVKNGAAPSNTADVGPAMEMSAAELAAAFDVDLDELDTDDSDSVSESEAESAEADTDAPTTTEHPAEAEDSEDAVGVDDEETAADGTVASGDASDDLPSASDSPESDEEASSAEATPETTTDSHMTDENEIVEKLGEMSDPVAIESEELAALHEKVAEFEKNAGEESDALSGELRAMNERVEALQERTELLDSVDRSLVEALADSDNPKVVETSEWEALAEEVETVKREKAELLASHVDLFDAEELMEKYDLEELSEKVDALDLDVVEDEEAASEAEDATEESEESLEADPAPKSGDSTEEELSTPEVDDSVLEAAEKLEKIGWVAEAEKMRKDAGVQ